MRLYIDHARIVPCPHECGWEGRLGDFSRHRIECPTRALLPDLESTDSEARNA